MKTSIIIPVYNVQDYLERCVLSVLKMQSELEIILVNDGSTDGSGALCDDLALRDDRIRVIHQRNGGLSAARNTGIQNSTGEYILFLDSDDFLDPKEADKLLTCCQNEADVVMGLYRKYYTEQDRYEPENSPAFLTLSGLVSAKDFLHTIPKDGQTCYMTAWRFVPRRDILLNNDLLFMPGIYHEDEEWTQRLLCYVDNIYVSHAWFYQYRQARAGAIMSTVKPKSVWDTLTILERTLYECEHHEEAYKREYLSYRAAQHYLNVMFKSEVIAPEEKEKVYDLLERCRKQCTPFLSGIRGKVAKGLIKLFGVEMACRMVQKLRKMVRKLRRAFRKSNL